MEEEILMIKNCKDLLNELGRLALYRDFKKFLMAIFGHMVTETLVFLKSKLMTTKSCSNLQIFRVSENNTAIPAAFVCEVRIYRLKHYNITAWLEIKYNI